MDRTRKILSPLCLFLVWGCHRPPDFSTVTTSFDASKASGISMVELKPLDVGTTLLTLRKSITITDSATSLAIVGEMKFLDYPPLPTAMGHSGDVAACKMLVQFNDGRAFCFCILFREGGAGPGVEYIISPNLNLDSPYQNNLPGNHTLGRGYSIKLYQILHGVIADAGGGWAGNTGLP